MMIAFRLNTNWAVQPQKMAKCLSYMGLGSRGIVLYTKHVGSDQLATCTCLLLNLLASAKWRFSDDVAHLLLTPN